MKRIIGYVRSYALSVTPAAFARCTLFIAIAIFCNYYFGINKYIIALPRLSEFAAWSLVFFVAFSAGYLLQWRAASLQLFQKPMLLFLLLAAPLLFAWKMISYERLPFMADVIENSYWNHVVYWPLKLVVITIALYFIWKRCNPEQPFYGTSFKGFDVKPYLGLLLLMLPLLLWASTQPDFLATYPKLKNSIFLAQRGMWYYKLLYELSYGTDFFTIELFFRGFLVLAFAKWFGKDAVLPMALFYCTIHFGKPLGECISSYFGGLILGAIMLQTRSIWGGLMVHLGIAWLMELFGYFGHQMVK